jgi:hypothetical protein
VTRPRERRGGVAPVRVIEMVTGEVVARAEGVLIEMLDSDDRAVGTGRPTRSSRVGRRGIIRCRPQDADGETRTEFRSRLPEKARDSSGPPVSRVGGRRASIGDYQRVRRTRLFGPDPPSSNPTRGLRRTQRPFRPNGTGARHGQLALLVASARLTSFGEAWFQRRKAWRKLAVSLKPKARAMSSTVISVSRKYFMATSARD